MEPTTLGEALERIWAAEEKLARFGQLSSFGTHFGILFLGLPRDTQLKDLPKTRAVGHDIDHGTIFARLVVEQEVELQLQIINHPIKAKRLGLK